MSGGGTVVTPGALQVIADTAAEAAEALCAVLHPITGRCWRAAAAGDWELLADQWADEIYVVPA